MVGSALVRRLQREDCEIVTAPRDQRRPAPARPRPSAGWRRRKPEAVFLAAAKVGGILANDTLPADFLYDNLMIETQRHRGRAPRRRREAAVPRLVLHLSEVRAAADPRGARCSPGRSSRPTNGTRSPRSPASSCARPIAASTAATSSRAMPTNLYGPGDNFDLEHSHVLPALMRKAHEAKLRGAPTIDDLGHRHARAASSCTSTMPPTAGLPDAELFRRAARQCRLGRGPDDPRARRPDLRGRGLQGRHPTTPAGPTARRARWSTRLRRRSAGGPRRRCATGLATTYRWYVDNVAPEAQKVVA